MRPNNYFNGFLVQQHPKIEMRSVMCLRKSIMVFVAVLFIVMLGGGSLQASSPEDAASKAFELRMNGKADEARALLEEAVSGNPDDAAAHYELARTLIYLMTSDPMLTEKYAEQAKASIEKATELEPDNVAYVLFEGGIALIHAYIAGMGPEGHGAGEKPWLLVVKSYKRALEIRPDILTPMLYLVEIYGALPEEEGGDRELAEQYAEKLEKQDAILGAKARSILLAEDTDSVSYWEEVLQRHPGNAEVLEELGKSCLYNERYEEGAKFLEEAVKVDPSKNFLMLDLARFHFYRLMEGNEPLETILAVAVAEKAAMRYLETEPIAPMKAYTLGILAGIRQMIGNWDAAAQFQKEADEIDPYCSKASGLPDQNLFLPPSEVPKEHRYLFRPL